VRNGVIISAVTGGGSITLFAGNAAILANSLTALPSVNAGNTRANEKLYRKGALFAENAACTRRYAGRQGLSITGGNRFNTQGKKAEKHTQSAGRGNRLLTAAASRFFSLHAIVGIFTLDFLALFF
jgi:hypothetical protein